MKTMKKFWKYFLNFVILILLVYGLTWFGIWILNKDNNNENQNIECITEVEDATIEIIICDNKKIEGTITNNSSVLINNAFIKADFYNKSQEHLGSKYFEIKYFNVREKAKFEIEHSFKDVSSVKLTMTDTIV